MANAAQKSQELNINLLQKEGPTGSGGEALHWALTVGRYLVIAAEIIALATFGLAIKFSADKNDLKQRIKQAQDQVDAQAACHPEDPGGFCEDSFRNIQNRLNEIKTVRAGQYLQNDVLKEFLARIPDGFKLKTLTLDNKKISFSGSFSTSLQLQNLITSFSDSSIIVDLNIEELTSPTTTDPNFNFKASATVDPISLRASQNKTSGSNQ